MLVYGWDGPRNGVSRVADNDQQIRAIGTVEVGGDFPFIFLHFPFLNQGGYIMPTSLLTAPLALLNFQTFLRPCNAKLKGLSTRLIGKTKNLLLRKLGQVARQFSRQNKFLYPSFYSQCFLIRRLINNS